MTSYWEPVLPDTNAEFHMQLYAIGPIIEAAGLSVNNTSPELAMQQGSGAFPGYSINQSVTQGFGAGFTTVQSNAAPIAPLQVTGRIVLRMTLDDVTNMLTCSFSLDGGATFLNPFPPMHIFNGGVTDYDILLGAAAVVENNPPPPPPPSPQRVPLELLSVRNPSGLPESRRLTYRVSAPSAFLLGDPATAGATFKVKLDSVTQCFSMPAIGWSRNRRGYRYTDPTGTYGPVKMAQWRRGGGDLVNRVVVVGKNGQLDVVPPDPGTEADTNFHVVSSGQDYCASTAGGAIRPNDAKSFRTKNAPAPAACNVSACSPGGAFLD
jgi:hypothetical protein